jgi:hypothetical protein
VAWFTRGKPNLQQEITTNPLSILPLLRGTTSVFRVEAASAEAKRFVETALWDFTKKDPELSLAGWRAMKTQRLD